MSSNYNDTESTIWQSLVNNMDQLAMSLVTDPDLSAIAPRIYRRTLVPLWAQVQAKRGNGLRSSADRHNPFFTDESRRRLARLEHLMATLATLHGDTAKDSGS